MCKKPWMEKNDGKYFLFRTRKVTSQNNNGRDRECKMNFSKTPLQKYLELKVSSDDICLEFKNGIEHKIPFLLLFPIETKVQVTVRF